MNLIIWLVVGGVIGWISSLIMKTDAQQGLVLNIVVGIIGAFSHLIPQPRRRGTCGSFPPAGRDSW